MDPGLVKLHENLDAFYYHSRSTNVFRVTLVALHMQVCPPNCTGAKHMGSIHPTSLFNPLEGHTEKCGLW